MVSLFQGGLFTANPITPRIPEFCLPHHDVRLPAHDSHILPNIFAKDGGLLEVLPKISSGAHSKPFKYRNLSSSEPSSREEGIEMVTSQILACSRSPERTVREIITAKGKPKARFSSRPLPSIYQQNVENIAEPDSAPPPRQLEPVRGTKSDPGFPLEYLRTGSRDTVVRARGRDKGCRDRVQRINQWALRPVPHPFRWK